MRRSSVRGHTVLPVNRMHDGSLLVRITALLSIINLACCPVLVRVGLQVAGVLGVGVSGTA